MNRLRSYRMIEGIAQDQLGELLGLSPQMISAVEGGRRSFNGDLAPLGYSNDRLELPDMSEPLHRQRASTKVATRKRAKELIRLAGEVFGELRERTAGAPDLMLRPGAAPISLDDLDDLALDVRYSLRHEESGAIRNLTSLVERAGVCLVPIVGLGVDGLSSWVGDVPVIGLAPNVPGDRFRLTLGHELAHLLFHKRPTATTEHEANRFASNLLFPQSEFEEQMPDRPQLRDFVALKSSWGVSVAALVYRAHDLEIIDDSRYRALQIQMSKWRRNEPGQFNPVHGELMSRLIETNGGTAAVAKDLGVNPKHLAELGNWSHLRVA
ncbi:ImmA/IrrE family metallo-endopeptidase [Nocardioides sp. SLBN-35]|uniref:ImmA/IrrE family metallo-endopeptidase n=1 Tax=Nocardioides sp. SLBN-35 TaxID=2768445 RepID=UPI00114E4304|nr:ImmA/IrrE family metallo-endopeptidase [Nocardioides sp. SLBN-35]TQK73347.1 Zn-dependent peptidase ImmA (M78 family) [Nocardioides sp. SLBN-35]